MSKMDTPDQNRIEYIERYLNNELSDQERIAFEAEIQSDQELRAHVDWVRKLPDFLFTMERERLSKQVGAWMDGKTAPDQDSTQDAKQKPANSFSRIVKIFASLAAAFIFMYLGWLILNKDKTPIQQANEYIALHHSDPITLRGNQKEEWQRAIQFYKEQDFNNMIISMKPIIDDQNVTSEQLFYAGLAHLYVTPPSLDSALYYFSLNTQKDPITYKEDIDWYSSLIYIKQGETEKARALLSTIQKSTSKNRDHATQLLRKLSE